MPRNDEPLHENEIKPPEGRVELPPENSDTAAGVAGGLELTQAELLAQLAVRQRQAYMARQIEQGTLPSRRGLFRLLGRSATHRADQLTEEDPKNEPEKPRRRISRRRLNRGLLVGGAALWLSETGLTWVARHWQETVTFIGHTIRTGHEVAGLLTFRKAFHDKMNALPTDEQLKRDVPNLGHVIDFDNRLERRKTKGPVNGFPKLIRNSRL